MIKNTAGQSIGAQMVSATTGAAFSSTVTVYLTLDAGTQAIGETGSGVCTHEGNGYHTYRPTQAETNGDLVAFTFIGSGAIPQTIQVATVTAAQQASLTAVTGATNVVTAQDLITAAMGLIGVLALGETLGPDESADAFARLNRMVDRWGTQPLTMGMLLRTTKTLTASTASYTIGTGGAIDIVRPTEITYANLIIDTAATTVTEIGIPVFTDQAWAGVLQKTLTGPLIQGIYYDRGWTAGLGIVYPWPIPTVGTTQLVLYTPVAVSQFATLTAEYSFRPGYQDALEYNLAKRLAAAWSLPCPPDVIEEAKASLADIKRPNSRLVEMGTNYPGVWGTYDIVSGGYR